MQTLDFTATRVQRLQLLSPLLPSLNIVAANALVGGSRWFPLKSALSAGFDLYGCRRPPFLRRLLC